VGIIRNRLVIILFSKLAHDLTVFRRQHFFTRRAVEKDMEIICKKFENISSKTEDAAARPFQNFLYRWEKFCEPQHPLFSVTYVTPRVGDNFNSLTIQNVTDYLLLSESSFLALLVNMR
jgi:hypothetical protein